MTFGKWKGFAAKCPFLGRSEPSARPIRRLGEACDVATLLAFLFATFGMEEICVKLFFARCF
jgi:hypothetical protein